MREAMLVNGILGNSESWINITQKDIEDLDKPDTILKRKILSLSGNPSKCFMFLELGILPVKYVLMKKRMQFLHYILNENIDSMIVQVYNALREDHRKSNFVQLTNFDRQDLDIELTDEDIQTIPKITWKKYIKEKVNTLALEDLNYQNSGKEKTKNIVFSQIKMSKYLEKNKNTELSKILFSVRSRTLDVKEWLPWNYTDNICIAYLSLYYIVGWFEIHKINIWKSMMYLLYSILYRSCRKYFCYEIFYVSHYILLHMVFEP